ncbi:Uncharacterised protein [Salmonella enterica subsp. diarizonae]|uniref:Uncharacterized protein n=1 Tax=Salmonella diarizonae TaxID=59204 RepID=A0A379TUP7_SALDZ|nr:Uncharacterised protein [Salmonella enterica subsp. diarizonae]
MRQLLPLFAATLPTSACWITWWWGGMDIVSFAERGWL